MEIIQVFILGIVQGIAEFLPISSSAHLIIFRDIFGIGSFLTGKYEMSFDIALHFGTLLAILVYFFKDFLGMIKEGFTKGTKTTNGKILWYIVVATIPAAIVGFLFEEKIDEIVRSNYVLICACLAIMGIIIYFADHCNPETKTFKEMSIKDAILIGLSQVGALVPGFSRSGSTIAMSRVLKIRREDAAKFSFYLSAPVVAGAVAIKLLKGEMISLITYNKGAFIIGVSTSFIFGLLCIKFLLRYIKKHDYNVFMWYRFIMALLALTVLFIRGI